MSELPSSETDGSCGEATRKLPASLDEPSTAQQSSKKKVRLTDNIQFEFDIKPCGEAHRPIPPILKEGDVVSIPRSEGQKTKETPLYIRQHLVDKIQEVKAEFESTDKLHLYATGAPGCGKTCFFWMWAIMKLQEGKRLLFVQHRDAPIVWILEDEKLKRMKSPPVKLYNLFSVVEQLLDQQTNKIDFAVLDGVRMQDDASKTLMIELKNRTGESEHQMISKAVFVTSLQFYVPLGYVSRENDFDETVDFSIESWKESDYDRAVQSSLVHCPTIRKRLLNDLSLLTSSNNSDEGNVGGSEDEQIKLAVKLKYRYAGGSARFMFAFDVLKVQDQFDLILGRCNAADWEELASNSVASGAEASVNSLVQRFSVGRRFVCTPVSEYVLRRAYDVCRSKLTLAVSSAADKTKNPSLLGWAFEMGELDKLDIAQAANCQPAVTFWRAVQIDIVPFSSTTAEKRRGQLIRFCPHLLANYKNGTVIDVVESGTVIRCDIWNQGCFDVAFYVERTLITLQVTMAKYHSLKLSHVTDLRNALLKQGVVVDDVVHVAILKNATVESFRFAPATGTGRCMPSRKNQKACGVKVVKAGELKLISVPVGASHTCNVDAEKILIYDMK